MQNKITQNVFVSSEKFNKEKEYWQKKLAEITSFGDIPFDFCQQYSRATFNSFSFSIPKDVYEKTKELCNSSIHGMYAVAVTAIGFIIYKYCDIDDVIVGTPIFKQHGCGEFINDILALRCKLKNEMKFKDYLLQTWDEISNSNENMRYPIESVLTPVRTCQKGMALPMFGVLVEFTDIHQKAAELHKRCNLLFRFTTVEGGLTCRIIYRSDIYCNHTIKALHSHFVNYLKVITENPEVILSKIDIIDDGERQRLIHEYNDSAFYYDKEKSIYDYFQEQVQKFPESLAVICEGRSFSYMELNEKATRLAGYLFEKEVNSNSVVAIMMPRTEEMVVAILAVLKAGAVCLPIDTSYPLQRSRYILEDSRTAFILGTDYTEKLIGLPCEFIDYHEGLKEEYEQDNLPICTKAEDGAYIIYTSGTTGKPKGVLLSHRGIINHAYTKIKELDITGEDKVSQNLGINFVASIWQIFAPLFVGARLVVYSGDVVNDPYRLMEKVQEDGVTILEVVPPLLKSYLMLLDNGRERLGLQRMRKLVLTGEKTEAALVNRFYSKYSIPLVNAYGQSECSDDTLHYAIPYSTDTQKVPVGRPSNNTRIYILDRNMRLQPVGLAGEMYISGDGVAKGYINEPELTKERFLENPYESGNVMYKTGDLGRWLPDGNVEYIGRVDQQLKILGYRIEPSEIENCMMSHEWVEAAAVVDKGEGSEDRCIWAYMAAREENAVPEVRKHLEERLPGYMVPAKILQLEKLPLTANGKVDRKALREIGDTVEGREPVAPRNMTEGKIAGIWKELLKLEQVGIDDNFFELGGNSINAINLVLGLEKIGIKVKVADILKYSTIRTLAIFIEGKADGHLIISIAANGKDPEIKNGIMLEGIKPFNDLFYKNCFYNSLFPVLNYYNLSIMPVLMNDIIFYQFDKAKKDIVTYLPTRNIAEVISDMGIKAVIKTRSESIISDVTSALSAKKPVIIWTDCYYSPIRNDEYKRQHLPHTLLIYGYDQSEKVFYTIEHTKQNSSNYKSRKMYYDDVLSAYDGFQENYNKNMFNSYYDFYYDTDSTQAHKVYNSEEIKNMYRHNHERNREIIYSGLEGIKQFQEYFACICSDKETFFSNVENLIEKVNSAINAKKVEEYRIKSLSNDLKGPVNLIETIIEHWNLIRMNLLRLAHYQRYDKNHLEFYSGLFTQIYSLEHMYINLLELSFNSTKLLFKG